MGKFAKTQILGCKLVWKVGMRVKDAQRGIFGGRTSFLE